MTMKVPFKKQQFDAREEAIFDAVNDLLSAKGYDLMTMEDVAVAVGVAKGSLYKHFSSKESLAAAVLSRLLRQTLEVLDGIPDEWPAIRKLEQILRWSLQHRLRGGVPHLPATSRALQRSLILNLAYVALALRVNRRFHKLVGDARRAGDITDAVPDDVIVYTLYSRACDPTVEFLVRDGKLGNEEIVEAMVAATFSGFRRRSTG